MTPAERASSIREGLKEIEEHVKALHKDDFHVVIKNTDLYWRVHPYGSGVSKVEIERRRSFTDKL